MFGWGRREQSTDTGTIDMLRQELARLGERLEAAESRRDAQLELTRRELAESHETSRKLLKALGRSSLRIEQIEAMVSALGKEANPVDVAPAAAGDIERLLDALDQLDRAVASAAERSLGDLVGGLTGVRDRLDMYTVSLGLTRHRTVGVEVDGALFRVVGTATAEGAAPGAIVEIVRSAVTEGRRLVREGEVIVARENYEDKGQ